jgi:hypothetical protein
MTSAMTPTTTATCAGGQLLTVLHQVTQMLDTPIGGAVLSLLSEGVREPEIAEALRPAWDEVDPEQGAKVVRASNEAAATAVQTHPDRFALFAALPLHDPAEAARELEHAVRDLDAKGALVRTRAATGFLSDEVNWPLWEAAQSLDVPVYMHPEMPPKAVFDTHYADLGPALGPAMASGTWGWHADTGMRTIRLIVRGVFRPIPEPAADHRTRFTAFSGCCRPRRGIWSCGSRSDQEVGAFRDRSLAEQRFPYVFLEATYCKARVDRRVLSHGSGHRRQRGGSRSRSHSPGRVRCGRASASRRPRGCGRAS